MAKNEFPDPNSSTALEKSIAGFFFIFISKLYPLANRLIYMGEIIDFAIFLRRIQTKFRYVFRRELIWSQILELVTKDKQVTFIELGVANGYQTDWWITELVKREINFNYFGFDTFTGLPVSWRDFPAGAFSNSGKLPGIFNENLFFIKGLIQDTLIPTIDGKIESRNRLVVLFDLDLYEPSAFAYSKLKTILKTGDILYFDEARDSDERRLLQETVLKDLDLEIIAASYSNVAFKIK